MMKITLVLLVWLSLIRAAPGKPSLVVFKNVNGTDLLVTSAVTVRIGESLTLRCAVLNTENDFNGSVTWGRDATTTNELRLQTDEPSKLHLSPVSLGGEGIYFCRDGERNVSKTIRVLVKPAKFKKATIGSRHKRSQYGYESNGDLIPTIKLPKGLEDPLDVDGMEKSLIDLREALSHLSDYNDREPVNPVIPPIKMPEGLEDSLKDMRETLTAYHDNNRHSDTGGGYQPTYNDNSHYVPNTHYSDDSYFNPNKHQRNEYHEPEKDNKWNKTKKNHEFPKFAIYLIVIVSGVVILSMVIMVIYVKRYNDRKRLPQVAYIRPEYTQPTQQAEAVSASLIPAGGRAAHPTALSSLISTGIEPSAPPDDGSNLPPSYNEAVAGMALNGPAKQLR